MNVKFFLENYIGELIMIIAVLYIYKSNYDKKFKPTILNIISILLITGLAIVNNLYNPVLIRGLLSVLVIMALITIVFKENFKKSIIFACEYIVIGTIVEIITCLILSLFVKDINMLNENIYLKFIFSIFNNLILLMIFRFKYIRKLLSKLENSVYNKINLLGIIVLTILLLNSISVMRAIDLMNIYFINLSIVILFYAVFTITTIMSDKHNIKLLEEKNNELHNSFDAYAKTIDEYRILKHNLKNDLYTLKAGLNDEEQNKINTIIKKYNKNCEWINRIDKVPKGLQGILYLKEKEAKENKIQLILNTKKDIETNDKDFMDICGIVTTLIDNAIDASKKSKSRVILVNITETKKNVNIEIINKFINPVDCEKIGNKNYSTKEYKSGLGLNYVKNIKNNNIKVEFKIINNLFISNVTCK